MYDAQAATINVEDIATGENNRFILSNIRSNRKGVMKLGEANEQLWIRDEVEDHTDYRPEGAHDMGWLGYFVGKHKHLDEMHIRDFELVSGTIFSDVIMPFLNGLNSNRSITTLDFCGMDLLNGRVFSTLDTFFENNNKLKSINFSSCNFGYNDCRQLALALGSTTSKSLSLETVILQYNNISDQELVDIITALSMHPQLQTLQLEGNQVSRIGCIALSTLYKTVLLNCKHSISQGLKSTIKG